MNRIDSREPSVAEARAREAFDALPEAAYRAALLGSGIQESRTPSMHVAEGRRMGLDYAYALIDFDRLGLPESALVDVLELAVLHKFAGLNITHPFKQRIITFLDELSPEAAAIGAVNTVVQSGGRTVGHNTDGWGFAESFRREMPAADISNVILIGAGGAGAAIAHTLCEMGADAIAIFDVDGERSTELVASLNRRAGRLLATAVVNLASAVRPASGVINSTPRGMARYPGTPLPAECLRGDLWVADIIYFPAETDLLRAARAVGSQTVSGEGMAVFQAVKAFELITGRRPDANAMRRHFEAATPR